MKVLLLAHGGYLDRERVASGNSVRAYFLAHGLIENGIDVVHVYPEALDVADPIRAESPAPGLTVRTYQHPDELARLIEAEKPDVLLVGYWELVDSLAEALPMPIVLDLFAPRVLEAMYQPERNLVDEIPRMLRAYRRADRFLVCSQRQRTFLFPWLLLAGFDCRGDPPIDVVPLSTQPGRPHSKPTGKKTWRFVSGGVEWPWRRSDAYHEAIVRTLQGMPPSKATLLLLSGRYLYFSDEDDGELPDSPDAYPAHLVTRESLQPYGRMEELFTNCDVGLELADRNVEREHSQSFRAVELLRCGLPVICNDYLELADEILRYDAGWVIREPGDLKDLIPKIVRSPAVWARKSANAIALVDELFHYRKTILPLVQFVREPRPPTRAAPLRVELTLERDRERPTEESVSAQGNPKLVRGQTIAGELEGGAAQAEEALRVVRNMESSWSWRLTAPFRAIMLRLREIPSPGRISNAWLNVAARRLLRFGANVLRFLATALRPASDARSVIMVNRDDIFPPDHGAAVRIDQVARGLSRHLDSVYLITDERRRYHAYRAGERFEVLFPDWLSRLGPPHRWVKDCVEREMGVPDTESFLYFPLVDWSYIVRTAYVAFRHPSGTYLAEGYPAFARPCLWGRRIFGGKVILSEHNVEYERLATQYQLAPRATEALRHIELLMCNEADAVVTVSDGDRRQLVSSGVDERRIHVVPHGVDLRSFEHAQALDLHAKFGLAPETQILVYHGAYTYSPNLDAVRIFATEILPHLRAAGCQPKLIAIGRNAGVAWTHDDVLFAGPVDNVAPYLLAADLAVVPLRHGGGTRMKILDYFAAGLPVVSTTKGAEGTTAESGVHLVIEDEPEQFAQAVLHLLHNPEDAARLGATSRAFVERRGWDAVIAQYAALMG